MENVARAASAGESRLEGPGRRSGARRIRTPGTRLSVSASGNMMKTLAALPTRPELQYPVEFFWLLGLVFFVPLFEAPKNLCWLGYALTWLYNRIRAREWGGSWDRWDGLIAAWIASGYVVAAFAGIHNEEWKETNDIPRYGSILWLLKVVRPVNSSPRWAFASLLRSTPASPSFGYLRGACFSFVTPLPASPPGTLATLARHLS